MIRELITLHRAIQAYVIENRGAGAAVRYFVQGSSLPGIYNMGGDLAFFASCVRHGDRARLRRYAYDCVESVHAVSVGLDCNVVTVALVQGDALGGGFEGALSCNVLIAERQAKLGLPEILFNSFPGMGAYSFLARRLGTAGAERMILKGQVLSADEMFEMGLVDQVVDEGQGAAAVQAFLSDSDRGYATREALYRIRQRVNPITIQEMRDITDIWVDTMMCLSDADLRRMELLQAAQTRRLAKRNVDDLACAAE
ncbi:enoyl-CoA hydratase [Lutibaculum baratangense AMV1]|uniref:Enoyl-CoA hydratase n=2 Tax=Lutibaculum TaxID=1358438 RepID=V4RCH2_9HYPH|nr:enoyl-CoA hydratase [Lutibaculum baratangense AMV1]